MKTCKVWLVGHTGMVGQAVAQALTACGVTYVGSGQNVDITDAAAVSAFAQKHQPSHIINCAAMTAVDLCEDEAHQQRAMAVNGLGPKLLAEAAQNLQAAFLHLSTDYVFCGTVAQARGEQDPTQPASWYGRSKLLGEQGVLGGPPFEAPRYVVRTSWVFGPGGNNFVATMLRLMGERDTVQVVADQHGRPTYTRDLAQAILGLLGLAGATQDSKPSGMYHFANTGATTWHGLCLSVAQAQKALGRPLKCTTIAPVTTAAFVRPAPRPAHSVLDTQKIEQTLGWQAPHFAQAVAHYLEQASPSP